MTTRAFIISAVLAAPLMFPLAANAGQEDKSGGGDSGVVDTIIDIAKEVIEGTAGGPVGAAIKIILTPSEIACGEGEQCSK